MENLKCRICNNSNNNVSLLLFEKMFGTSEAFNYLECVRCGCVQLVDENISMQLYYPDKYFSYNDLYNPNTVKDFIGKEYLKFRLGKLTLIGFLASLFMKRSQSWVHKQYISFNSNILDVGCGSGRLLQLLHHRGFKHLTGIEPYNKDDILYDNKVKIFNHTLFEHTGKYDFIMLHYSLEHMPNIHNVMQKLLDLLADNGTILIRIPIIDSFAYRKYRQNWVQMDAPRHICLFTVQGFMMLCAQYNLQLDKIEYDSSDYQFIQSEKYRRGLTFNDSLNISRKDQKKFQKLANHLNTIQDGDQVSFYLKK